MPTAHLTVSDHAVMRYCERVLGADLELIRRTIIAEAGPLHAALGDGRFPIHHGAHLASVRNNVVTSILPPNLRPPETRPVKRKKPNPPKPEHQPEPEPAAYEHILALARDSE